MIKTTYAVVQEYNTYDGYKTWYRTPDGEWDDTENEAYRFESWDLAELVADKLNQSSPQRHTVKTLLDKV